MGGFRQAAPTGIVDVEPTSHPISQSTHQPTHHSLAPPHPLHDEEEPGSPMNHQPTDHMVRIHDDPEPEPGVIDPSLDQSTDQSMHQHIDVEFVPHHQQVNNYNQTLDEPIAYPMQQSLPTDQHIYQPTHQPIHQPKSVNLRDIRAQHGVPQAPNHSHNIQQHHQQGVQMVPLAVHQSTTQSINYSNGQSNIHTIHTQNAVAQSAVLTTTRPVNQRANQPTGRFRRRRKSSANDRPVDPSVNASMPYPAPMFSRTRRSLIPNFRILSITNAIMIGCIVMMIVELVVGADRYDGAFVDSNPMGGPSIKTLYRLGGKWEPDIRNDGAGWRLLSAIWLHSGLLHIAMNLLTLAVIGYTAEQRFTWPVYLIIYLAAGVLGNLWSCVTYAASVGVGASGAIFGIIGAQLAHLLYNYRLIENAFAELIMLLIVSVVGICLGFVSQVSSNMDVWAHCGGFLTGCALGFAITPYPAKRHFAIEATIRLVGILGTVALFLIFSLLLWVDDPKGPENVSNL